MTFPPNDSPSPGAPARRISPAPRGVRLCFTFDGQPVTAYEGETVAAVLLAAGRRAFRMTSRGAEPRGLFCCMGALLRLPGPGGRPT